MSFFCGTANNSIQNVLEQLLNTLVIPSLRILWMRKRLLMVPNGHAHGWDIVNIDKHWTLQIGQWILIEPKLDKNLNFVIW